MKNLKKNKFFVHESSYVDKNVRIGEGSKIWHFSHIQSGAIIGCSTTIGQNVNVGNNVKIGGGSGVINDISNDQKVMGYPAVSIKEFIKKRKKNEK